MVFIYIDIGKFTFQTKHSYLFWVKLDIRVVWIYFRNLSLIINKRFVMKAIRGK